MATARKSRACPARRPGSKPGRRGQWKRCACNGCAKRARPEWHYARKEFCTRGCRNIAWIEEFCRIPEGEFVGQKVELRGWQRDILRGIYDQPTRRAIVSFGRKNAKTTLVAMLLLLHLCGPEARANSQLYSAAQSRDQASILFSLAAKMVRMSAKLAAYVTVRDTAKQLLCQAIGTLYRALSAEASTAYGLSPVFIVHDELGQVRGPRSELYEALETSTAAQVDPLSIVISTQAPTEADLLSTLIDDVLNAESRGEKPDPRVRLSLYTADPDADPFAEETIRQANPAFGDFQNADDVLAMAEDARRMPSREAEYRNLVLNQRVESSNPFISRSVWEENGDEPDDDWGGRRVYAGLDLSEVNDLTALVLTCPIDGVLHVRPTFWLPEVGLRERSLKDRVHYDVWHQQGYLLTTPGRTVEYDHVAEHIVALLAEMDLRVAFDRWNMRHFRPCLARAGMSEEDIEERFVEFGQGFQSMSPALRETESLLLGNKVRHGNHPVLSMCAHNAVVTSNPAGGRKLDKSKARGRIDGMVALVMAASLAADEMQEDATPPLVLWA